ncbi:Uncharacterised protein [Mycobacterium tuberculosis]|nr:Uncharacterised protein [Mycobacterium tuberculosis]
MRSGIHSLQPHLGGVRQRQRAGRFAHPWVLRRSSRFGRRRPPGTRPGTSPGPRRPTARTGRIRRRRRVRTARCRARCRHRGSLGPSTPRPCPRPAHCSARSSPTGRKRSRSAAPAVDRGNRRSRAPGCGPPGHAAGAAGTARRYRRARRSKCWRWRCPGRSPRWWCKPGCHARGSRTVARWSPTGPRASARARPPPAPRAPAHAPGRRPRRSS